MKYFGTDGFRGEANIDLTARDAYRIGRFLGFYFKNKQVGEERPKIVIGKDTRRSSYMLENALATGIVTSGSDAYLLHVTTTPSVSYCMLSGEFVCGIMISASHNPYLDNGIKIIDDNGNKMEDQFLEKIEGYIDREEDDLPLAYRDEIGEVRDYSFGRNRYIGYLIQTVQRSFKHLRIGLDCANGSAFQVAQNVFEALGAETYVIHNHPDGTNINVDCGSTHIESMVDLVKKEGLDCGFAFDGDADRCIAVDEKGKVVDGDGIIYITAWASQKRDRLSKDTVVTTVMSNFGLAKSLSEKGIRCVQTPVGDKFVAAEMAENGYDIGGEQSGHIIFSKYATTGDGVLTALRLTEIMVEEKVNFSTLHRDLKIYPQILENVKVVDKHKVLENPAVKDRIDEVNDRLAGDGRSLVRPSGTEPLLRVMVEHKDPEVCRQAVDDIVEVIHDQGLVVEN